MSVARVRGEGELLGWLVVIWWSAEKLAFLRLDLRFCFVRGEEVGDGD